MGASSKNPLTTDLLARAYTNGYFPMADPKTKEVLWYRPDPRAILPLDNFKVSKSLKKSIRNFEPHVSYNRAFLEVMRACGDREEGNWMTEDFFEAYGALHRQGRAHSVEIWNPKDKTLVGGVYGVSFGAAFFAESKFHRKTDASKAALYFLIERLNAAGYQLLEVQFLTPHLESLGAIEISDLNYQQLLVDALHEQPLAFT